MEPYKLVTKKLNGELYEEIDVDTEYGYFNCYSHYYGNIDVIYKTEDDESYYIGNIEENVYCKIDAYKREGFDEAEKKANYIASDHWDEYGEEGLWYAEHLDDNIIEKLQVVSERYMTEEELQDYMYHHSIVTLGR